MAATHAATPAVSGLRNLSAMFDRDIIDGMRREFDAADKDGNGQLDAQEACELFARSVCAGGSTADEEEVRRTAESLMSQMDADRSGTISFEEYCFRFGRRYQVEAARRRRAELQRRLEAAEQSQPAGPAAAASETSTEPAAEPTARSESSFTTEPAAAATAEPAPAATAGTERAVPPAEEDEHRRLPAGSVVVLQELRGAAQLNGRQAKVLRFDEGAGRYVVELEGEGGQKSLRPENLKATGGAAQGRQGGLGASGAASTVQRLAAKAKVGLQQAVARVQLALADYEWWQIALGAALVLLFAMAYFQLQSRYPAAGGGNQQRTKTGSARPGQGQGQARSRYADEGWDDGGRGDWDRARDRRPPPRDHTQSRRSPRDEPPRRSEYRYDRRDRFERGYEDDYRADDYHEPRGRDRRHRRHHDDYDYHDSYDGGYDRYGGQAARGGSGLLGEWGQLYTMLIIGGLGYLCWTGVIPVHRMSWFQIYMLWNIVEPLLLGGRGRGLGGGFGGFGRRRRGFF